MPDWAEIMDMALAFHVPPWEVEAGMTLLWLMRWRAWVQEQPAAAEKR